jgi:hypothetical protein
MKESTTPPEAVKPLRFPRPPLACEVKKRYAKVKAKKQQVFLLKRLGGSTINGR